MRRLTTIKGIGAKKPEPCILNQWPCEDWFHIPTYEEWKFCLDTYWLFKWSLFQEGSWEILNCFFLPLAWCINTSYNDWIPRNELYDENPRVFSWHPINWIYLTCDYTLESTRIPDEWVVVPAWYNPICLVFDSEWSPFKNRYIHYHIWSWDRCNCFSIRPFKNDPVNPIWKDWWKNYTIDSWITSAWIYQNLSLWLISVVNWDKIITMSTKNIWATVEYTSNGSPVTKDNWWYMFQARNNHWFDMLAEWVNTSESIPNLSLYTPCDKYNDELLYVNNSNYPYSEKDKYRNLRWWTFIDKDLIVS